MTTYNDSELRRLACRMWETSTASTRARIAAMQATNKAEQRQMFNIAQQHQHAADELREQLDAAVCDAADHLDPWALRSATGLTRGEITEILAVRSV